MQSTPTSYTYQNQDNQHHPSYFQQQPLLPLPVHHHHHNHLQQQKLHRQTDLSLQQQHPQQPQLNFHQQSHQQPQLNFHQQSHQQPQPNFHQQSHQQQQHNFLLPQNQQQCQQQQQQPLLFVPVQHIQNSQQLQPGTYQCPISSSSVQQCHQHNSYTEQNCIKLINIDELNTQRVYYMNLVHYIRSKNLQDLESHIQYCEENVRQGYWTYNNSGQYLYEQFKPYVEQIQNETKSLPPISQSTIQAFKDLFAMLDLPFSVSSFFPSIPSISTEPLPSSSSSLSASTSTSTCLSQPAVVSSNSSVLSTFNPKSNDYLKSLTDALASLSR